MKKKLGRLLRRSKSKPDLSSLSASSSNVNNDKPYAECVVNRAALALDERQDVESRASGSDMQRMTNMSAVPPQVSGGLPNSNMSIGGSVGTGREERRDGSQNDSGNGSGGGGGMGSGSSLYGGSQSIQSAYGGGAYSVVSGLSTADQSSAFVSGMSTADIDSRKLVIQYFLQDAEATFVDDGRARKSLGAGMAVKVKARVENAPLSLEENLQIQLEEDRRAMSERDPRAERYQPRLEGFVHCVAPPSSNIDASDAIGLVSNYVVAYRALHRSCDRPLRRHDKVLITNAHGSLGRSLVELSLLSGASVVFGTAPTKYHERLSKWGATPLDADDADEDGWSDLLLGSVDVVIDTDAGDACPAAPIVANQATGKLVRILTGPNAGGDVKIWRKKNSLMDQPVRTAFYDVFHDMEVDPAGFRADLQLLFDMMYSGSIRPRKKKAIPLLGVSYIELRFDRAPYRPPSADASSASSRNTRSKSVGSTRSGSGRGSRSQSSSRSRPEQQQHMEPPPPEPHHLQQQQQQYQPQQQQQQEYVERRSKSAPRPTGRGWDDAADEIARSSGAAAAAVQNTKQHRRSSSRGSTRSSSTSRSRDRNKSSSSRHRREEDEIARRSRQRLAAEQQQQQPHEDHRAIQRKDSSASTSSRSKGNSKSKSSSRSSSGRSSSSKQKERSKSAPRNRDSNGGWRGGSQRERKSSRSAPRAVRGESSGDDAISRSSSSRTKMKSGRTDRSKSAPRERYNDENDGGAGNSDRYNDDRNGSPKSYRSRETSSKSVTSKSANVFDFRFW